MVKMVPVTPELLDTIRYCRWGVFHSFVASIPSLEKRQFLGFRTDSADFSQTSLSDQEFNIIFTQFNSLFSDTFALQTIMSLAIVSGNNELVDYILTIPDFLLTTHDFFVCLLLGSVYMLRKMTWKSHNILFRRIFASCNAAMVLAKASYHTFVENSDPSKYVPDFGEKLEFLISMGMTMFEVDGCGCNALNIMIKNKVPVRYLRMITNTLTKYQLDFVDQRFNSPLLIAINEERPYTILLLIESGATMFGDDLTFAGDLRTRLSPMRHLVLLPWMREITRYLTLLELAHRGITLEKERLFIKYKVRNFFMLYLLGEMGLKFRLERRYEEYVGKDNHVQRVQWTSKIFQYLSKPRTLQSLARSAIQAALPPRKKIGPPLLTLARQGIIPSHMYEYMMFREEIMVAAEYRKSTQENPMPGWYAFGDSKSYFDKDAEEIDESPQGLIFPPKN